MRARCACGVPIIGDRATWAIPTCVGCLPPPPPLPIAPWPPSEIQRITREEEERASKIYPPEGS